MNKIHIDIDGDVFPRLTIKQAENLLHLVKLCPPIRHIHITEAVDGKTIDQLGNENTTKKEKNNGRS